MYGTVARLRAKPGKEAELRSYVVERKPKGMVGGAIYQLDSDPRAFIMTVLFEDKASYHANAQDPAQDREYQRLRGLLSEDPIWDDGEVVATF